MRRQGIFNPVIQRRFAAHGRTETALPDGLLARVEFAYAGRVNIGQQWARLLQAAGGILQGQIQVGAEFERQVDISLTVFHFTADLGQVLGSGQAALQYASHLFFDNLGRDAGVFHADAYLRVVDAGQQVNWQALQKIQPHHHYHGSQGQRTYRPADGQ